MASHKVGRGNQIRRANGTVAKAQVRTRKTTRFLAVVGKIGLAVFFGGVTDNFDGVFVGPHRTVGTQAVEFGSKRAFGRDVDFGQEGQRAERYIVHNAHRKLVLGFFGFEVVEHRHHLSGRGVFGTQTEAAANDERTRIQVAHHFYHV